MNYRLKSTSNSLDLHRMVYLNGRKIFKLLTLSNSIASTITSKATSTSFLFDFGCFHGIFDYNRVINSDANQRKVYPRDGGIGSGVA